MLEEKDIKNLIGAMEKVFPKKDGLISAMEKVFPTEIKMNKKFDKIEESFSDLQTSVDAYAKQSNDYFQEMVVLNNNYHRLEKWIQQVAEKVGIELKY